jgi:hypothetical protein
MKIPTASCANTSRRRLIWLLSIKRNSTPLPGRLTDALDKRSTGGHHLRCSQRLLRRPAEATGICAWVVPLRCDHVHIV